MFYLVSRLQGLWGRGHLYSEFAQHTAAVWQGCQDRSHRRNAPSQVALPWGRGTLCKPPWSSPCAIAAGAWTVTQDTQASWPKSPLYLGSWQEPG